MACPPPRGRHPIAASVGLAGGLAGASGHPPRLLGHRRGGRIVNPSSSRTPAPSSGLAPACLSGALRLRARPDGVIRPRNPGGVGSFITEHKNSSTNLSCTRLDFLLISVATLSVRVAAQVEGDFNDYRSCRLTSPNIDFVMNNRQGLKLLGGGFSTW